MLRSSVFTVYADELPLDEQGQLLPGYIQVTHPAHPLPPDAVHDRPRHVLHAAPGVAAPERCATVTVDGGAIAWRVEQLATAHPDAAPYVLDAEWLDADGEGEPVIRRGKMVEVPAGVTPTATHLQPHQWLGDGDE